MIRPHGAAPCSAPVLGPWRRGAQTGMDWATIHDPGGRKPQALAHRHPTAAASAPRRTCETTMAQRHAQKPRRISGKHCQVLDGPIAQRLEQRTHNPLVPGSNPGGPTIFSTSRYGRGCAHRSCRSGQALLAAEAWFGRPFPRLAPLGLNTSWQFRSKCDCPLLRHDCRARSC